LTEKNPKNLLQEYSQKKWGILPRYKFSRKTRSGFAVLVYIERIKKQKGAVKARRKQNKMLHGNCSNNWKAVTRNA